MKSIAHILPLFALSANAANLDCKSEVDVARVEYSIGENQQVTLKLDSTGGSEPIAGITGTTSLSTVYAITAASVKEIKGGIEVVLDNKKTKINFTLIDNVFKITSNDEEVAQEISSDTEERTCN